MITRRTINGREVTPIGYGCMSLSWAYGVPPSDQEGEALLNRALDLGYDFLDTANIYGLGHNETLIGRALKGRRDEFFLATKMGIKVIGERRGIDCSPEAIRASVDEFCSVCRRITSISITCTAAISLYRSRNRWGR